VPAAAGPADADQRRDRRDDGDRHQRQDAGDQRDDGELAELGPLVGDLVVVDGVTVVVDGVTVVVAGRLIVSPVAASPAVWSGS
jgi:hypothetical protein